MIFKIKFQLLILMLPLCLKANIDSLNVKNQIEVLQSKIDSLSQKINTLETNQNLSNDIISEYQNINSLFETGFGILIGLFGVVFPLMLYFIQVKPSLEKIKEADNLIKKIDEDFDKSFKKHFNNTRNQLINEALDNFLNNNTAYIPISYHTLNSYKSLGFDELQVVKIIKLLKIKIYDDYDEFFCRLLILQEDKNIEDFFVQLINESPKDERCVWGALYFATFNKTEYIDLIAEIVVNGYSLTGMISSLRSSNIDFTIHLLNNQRLNNELNENEIKNYADYGIQYLIDKIGEDKVKNTVFWSKFKSE